MLQKYLSDGGSNNKPFYPDIQAIRSELLSYKQQTSYRQEATY